MKKESIKEFGKRLRVVIGNYDRKKLANLLNRDERTINNWLSGNSLPSVKKLIKIIEMFNADPKYLFFPFLGEEDQEYIELCNIAKQIFKFPEEKEQLKDYIRYLQSKIQVKVKLPLEEPGEEGRVEEEDPI